MRINKNKGRITIVAGGTGGHVYPAFSISRILSIKGYVVDFLIDHRGYNIRNLNSDFKYTKIWVLAPKSSFISKLKSLFSMFVTCLIILIKFIIKRPKVVVGFGGYVTFPVLVVAYLLRIKIVLHEQNSYAGKVNRWFSPHAIKIATGFKNVQALPSKKTVYTGTPLRESFLKNSDEDIFKHKNKLFKKNNKLNLIITGGSQGTFIFGEILPKVLIKFKNEINLIHQVRKEQINKVKNFYKKERYKAKVISFIDNISDALKDSHISISRSGAGTINENNALGLISIYIPYKYSADNHQYYNALECVKNNSGILVEQKNFNEEIITKILLNIINSYKLNNTKYTNFAMNAKSNNIINADKKVAELIESIIN